MRDDGEDVPAGEDAEGAGDAGDADDLRGLSAAALLAGAREAHAREQRQAGVTTAERVRLGQWLAAIKRREAFRAEGCASLAAWAQEKLKIRTAMTERYVRIAVLPVALVAQHDLGVSKLSRLVGCPEPVLAGLLPLASGWTEPVLAVAVTAARRVYGRSHDDVAALAAAQASAAQAVARALELRAAKGRTRRRGGALDAVTVVRQAIEAIKAKIAEAREKDPAVCAELAPRLHELGALLGGPYPVGKEGKPKENDKIDESRGAAEGRPAPPPGRPAAVAAGPSARPRVLDDEPLDGTPDEPDDQADDQANDKSIVEPGATVVSLVDLMKALREGQTEEEAACFSNAIHGLLANENRPWETVSRQVIEEVAAAALHAGRFPEVPLREWARRVLAERLEDRWQLLFNSFQSAPDLPQFAEYLDDLRQARLPEDYLAQVREVSERHPPIDRPPTDPAQVEAWLALAEADIADFMATLPTEVW